jgi:Copine
MDATLGALKDVDASPLSVVFVGIGTKVNLSGLSQIGSVNKNAGLRDNVRYVHYETDMDQQLLTKAALKDIPIQLETYFIGKNMYPERAHDVEEIIVLPYHKVADIEVPMVINETTGEVTVTADVKPPNTNDVKTKLTLSELKRIGKQINANPTFRTIKQNINAKTIRQARYKINRMVGQKIL